MLISEKLTIFGLVLFMFLLVIILMHVGIYKLVRALIREYKLEMIALDRKNRSM